MTGPRRDTRGRARYAGKHVLLVGLALLTLFPLVLTVSTAFKTEQDVKTNPFGLFSSFSGDNLVTAWTVGRFGDYVLNSFLLTAPSTLLVVACPPWAATPSPGSRSPAAGSPSTRSSSACSSPSSPT